MNNSDNRIVRIAHFVVRGRQGLVLKATASYKEAKNYIMEMDPSERRGVAIVEI